MHSGPLELLIDVMDTTQSWELPLVLLIYFLQFYLYNAVKCGTNSNLFSDILIQLYTMSVPKTMKAARLTKVSYHGDKHTN